MTHPEQTELDAYMGGYVDGDGHIGQKIREKESSKISYHTSSRIMFAISGIIDAEGYVGLNIQNEDKYSIGFRPQTQTSIGVNHEEYIKDHFIKYLNDIGVNYYLNKVEYEDKKWNKSWKVTISELKSVKDFLLHIREHLVIKRPQAEIMLEEIIPRIENEKHHKEYGFLEIAAWKSVMDSYKGGNRGKYDLLYFEDKFGFQIDLERHELPKDLREQLK